MARNADVGDGTSFSTKQMVTLLSTAIALSGGGAWWTASASDAVQDEQIEQIDEAVKDLREDLTETRDAVIVMGPQVEAIEDDMSEIKADMKEILKHVAENGH